jgi:hypothetical protein
MLAGCVVVVEDRVAEIEFLAGHDAISSSEKKSTSCGVVRQPYSSPKLRVRHVSVVTADHIGHPTIFFSHGAEIRGGLAVVNVGGTKATIIESRYRIYVSKDGLPASAPYDTAFRNLLLPGQILNIGESCATPIVDKIVMEAPPPGIDVELRAFERDGWKIYVMGQIRYQDEGGHDRFMGFCRVGDGKHGFRAVDDADYEYED